MVYARKAIASSPCRNCSTSLATTLYKQGNLRKDEIRGEERIWTAATRQPFRRKEEEEIRLIRKEPTPARSVGTTRWSFVLPGTRASSSSVRCDRHCG